MKLKLDLHIHSNYSIDAVNTIDDIVKRIKLLGFDGYALADHDTLAGLPEAFEKKSDLIFIPALEVSAMGGHIIALDPTDQIPTGLSITESVELIHDTGATAILAHPYGLPRSWINTKEVKRAGFDAIEVVNSTQFPFEYINRKNRKLAEDMGLPMTGGSDSHIPDTIGRGYTIVDSPTRDIEDVIASIKRGDTVYGGSSITISERIQQFFYKKKRSWVTGKL
jgi:predicted metal-dependent phosphoesterase TrpH